MKITLCVEENKIECIRIVEVTLKQYTKFLNLFDLRKQQKKFLKNHLLTETKNKI